MGLESRKPRQNDVVVASTALNGVLRNMPGGDSWLKVENVATDNVAMKNSVVMPIKSTSNCGNPQKSEALFARQLAGEANKSNFSKINLCDRRRRKFLVDHENSRRNKLKQEATSEIIKELLNLSQFEVSEKEHLSRVLLQVDLIAENRSNRDQLIASECELNVERQSIWKEVEIAREVGWVVKHRILAQLESFNDHEKSRKAASDNRSVLASNATLLRIKQLNNWVKSCNSLGLFPSSEEMTQDFLASATCDTTEIISNLNKMEVTAEEDLMLSNAYSMFLSDAKVMYLSPLQIPKPVPKVEDLHLFEDLPYTISEHLSQVDVKWLLSEVLETQDMMPAADPSTYSTDEFQFKDRSLEGIWSRKVSFAKNSDLLLPSTPPLNGLLETTVPATNGFERVKDLWGSDHRCAMAEHLAVHDLDRYILDIGNAQVEGDYDRPPCISTPPAADTPTVPSSTQQQKRRGSVVVGEVEEVCSDPMNMVLAPSWLLTTPSKHLLGAVIVAVRCAAAVTATPTIADDSVHDSNLEVMNVEVCDDASAVAPLTDADFIISDVELGGPGSMATAMTQAKHSSCLLNSNKSVPVFSVRLALCGASDLAKKAVSNAVSVLSEGGVRIIRVDRLLSQAVDSAVSASDSTKSYLTVSSEGSCEGDDKQSLGLRALSILLKGQCIPDDIYVSLVIHAIQDLDAERRERALYSASDGTAAQGDAVTGFILEDFPNTKQQASLLVIALSGVDYNTHKPQPADHASRFAPIAPYEMLVHDSALCGLDRVLYLDATLEASLSERLSARMNTATNAVVFLSPEGDDSHADHSHMTSHMSHGDVGGYTSTLLQLKNLEEMNDSLSSRHTSSLDITLTSSTGEELREFLTKIGVLSQLHFSAYVSHDDYIDAAVKMLYQPAGRALDSNQHIYNTVTKCGDELYGTMNTCSREGVGEAVEEGNETANEMQAAPIEYIITNGGDSASAPQPVPTPMYTTLPIQLATALTGMWNTAENTSIEVGRVFFKTLRDYRYQMVQRRRVMHDALRLLQMRLDNRQDLFEDFIVGFNQIDDDFRFDPDCVAELHLRTLELRESILLGCDMRKRDADSFVLTASLDGIPQLLLHMSECEGVAMVQAEYNRFIVSIHLLLDYSKSMASYDCTKRVLNVLEETLQASVLDDSSTSSIAAKDGRKSNTTSSTGTGTSISGGGCGSTVGTVKKLQPVRKGSHNQTSVEPEVYRVPVPVISLPFGAMSEHPRSIAMADTVDDDARTVTTKSHRGKLDVR